MPWKECRVMDERLRFVARLLEGETMVALCEEFGISLKTGSKIYQRYRQIGVQGLTDRSRRPHRHANQLPMVVEKTIVRIKREYPSWGAPKIRERLRQRSGHFAGEQLLASQLATLEEPAPGEGVLRFSVAPPPEEIAAAIRRALAL